MSDDTKLLVRLEARITDFERQMRKAENTGTNSFNRMRRGSRTASRQMEQDMTRASTRINQALASTSSKVGSFAKSFGTGFLGGMVASSLANVSGGLDSLVKGIADVGREAKRAGVAVEAFQQWSYVARQNRIDVGALTDGFKELNLRADEFVITGKGSAAEAFERLGYTAQDLKRKMKDPSELMLEIIGRLEGMDKAAQIRIADELFGGTGGERFVELLDQGEVGIRKVMGEAKAAGAVINEALVMRADELDKRFAAIQERLGNGFKGAVITAADAIFGAGAEGELFELIGDIERVRSVLGEDLRKALIENANLIAENERKISDLNISTYEMTNAADALAQGYYDMADAAFAINDVDTAKALIDAGVAMDALIADFKAGEINASELADGLAEVKKNADKSISAISATNQLELSAVIGEVGSLSTALETAAGMARGLWQFMAGLAGVNVSGPEVPEGEVIEPVRPGVNPKARPENWQADMDGDGIPDALQDDPKPKGGRSKGGSKKDQYKEAAEGLAEQIRMLEAEALALIAVAESGEDYGDALEYARVRAELLHKAQQQGKHITPQLQAEIDALAQSYVTAGLNAEQAADRLRKIEDASQRGKDALKDLFGAALDGADAFKSALTNLISEIAKVQFTKGAMGLIGAAGGGGIMSAIGGLLSFDGGGYTGNGSRSGGLDGKGGFLAVMHPRENVTDLTKGQASGGAQEVKVHVTVGVDKDTGNLTEFVDQRAISVARTATSEGLRAYDRQLPDRVNYIRANPRMR